MLLQLLRGHPYHGAVGPGPARKNRTGAPSPQTRALEREVEDYSSPQPTSETLTDIHNLYYG